MDDGGRCSSATFTSAASASGSASPSPSPSPLPLTSGFGGGRRSRQQHTPQQQGRPFQQHQQQVRWQQQQQQPQPQPQYGDGEDMLLMTAAVQHALVSGGGGSSQMQMEAGAMVLASQRRRLSGAGGGALAERRAPGLGSLPRRVGATLKRKFWDSNELVSATAVQARDILATLYVNGRESTVQLLRHGSHRTVAVYGYARERAATTRLPWPFVPLRDGLILPCFRAVEASTQWLLSDRPGHYYNEVKRLIPVLPLGSTLILPIVYFAEGLAHVTLLVVQAPLPSAERVASAVELAMDMSKRGLGTVARECYYYVQLVDYHVTRTLARAQWEILGFGPYASLPRERRMEVMERMVERYLSMAHPLRRYEFMSQIKWQNSQLHDDLIGSEIILQRGGAMVEEDTWLDADASYRHHLPLPPSTSTTPLLLTHQSLSSRLGLGSGPGLAMVGGDVQPIWFRWDEESRAWEPFHPHECRRLERAYRRHLHGKGGGGGSGSSSAEGKGSGGHGSVMDRGQGQGQGLDRDGRVMSWGEASAMDSDAPGMGSMDNWRGGGGMGGGGTTSHYSGGETSDHPTAGAGTGKVVTDDSSPFSPEHAGPLLQHEVGPDDVFVDQGRFVVNLRRMVRLPVFWGFVGEGEPVRRGVWMHDTKQGFVPYPPRAALLLEDAYQYLQWYLASKPHLRTQHAPHAKPVAPRRPAAALPSGKKRPKKQQQREGEGKEEEDDEEDDEEEEIGVEDAGGVLLTVQVDGIDGDQLVQFRSLQDIWAVRKTWVGALSLFSRRRVLRGAGPYREPAPKPQPQEAASAEEAAAAAVAAEVSSQRRSEEGPAGFSSSPTTTMASSGAATVAQWHHRRLESSSSSSNLRKSRSRVDVTVAPPPPPPAPADGKEGGGGAGAGAGAGEGASGGIPLLNAPLEQWPVPSEEEDDCDLEEPVKHLVLVVHGIGQAMKRVELGVTQLKSIVECCDTMRSNTEEIDLQQQQTPPQQPQSSEGGAGAVEGRVEYIPVEWHTKFRERAGESEEMGQAGHLRLRDITLSRIPHLRSFVNDALLDVLYFMSPAYHQVILDEVAAEMNRVVSLFRKHCRRFSGKVSIAAHSLGGVICFDLLANQESVVEFAEVKARESSDPRRQHLKYVYTSYPRLDFGVSNLFALGSPIAVFLLVRRQHQALHHDFQLSRCLRLFNIFHPYDPVAYRLEPFIASRAYDPEADILPTWTGKLRVHYQVKKMVNRFWERLWEMKASIEDGVERTLEAVGLLEPPAGTNSSSSIGSSALPPAHASGSVADEGGSEGGEGSFSASNKPTPNHLEAYMRERMAATLRPPRLGEQEAACYDADGDGEEEEDDDDDDDDDKDEENEGEGDANMWPPALGSVAPEGEEEAAAWRYRKYGKLNWGDRIDYSLQEKEIEVANEYIFAIGAHVLYWGSKDLCNFIVKHVSKPEEEEAWRAMMQANSLLSPTTGAAAGAAAATAAAGAAPVAPKQQQSAQPSRRGSSALSASASSSLAAAGGEREKGASVEIPEAVKISMAS